MDENEMVKVTWIPLLLISLATFIIILDGTFMNVALSQLTSDLNTTISTIQLIISFYMLITASLILITVKLQDVYGKKKIFLVGAGIFGIGALIASLSQNILMLFIGWPLLGGIGGSLMIPTIVSIALETYEKDKRTFAMTVLSAMAAIAVAISPVFGGALTTFLTWRYSFVIELIIVLFIFIFSGKIKNSEPTLTKKDFDITGSVLFIFGLISLILGILLIEEDIAITIALVITSLVILSLFSSYEYRIKQRGKMPIFDISILKVRNLSLGTIILIITCIAMAGSFFAIPLFLESVHKFDAFTTALNVLPATIGILLSSIIAQKFGSKLNHKIMVNVGFLIAMVASTMLSINIGDNTSFTTIAPGMFLFGIGLGFVLSMGTDISLAGTSDKNQKSALGLLLTGQTLGSSMGIAIIGCILIVGATWGMHDAITTYAPEQVDNEQFHSECQQYLQKMGHTNFAELQSDTDIKEQIVDGVLTDAMRFVMSVTSALLALGLLLSLTLNDVKSYQLKKFRK